MFKIFANQSQYMFVWHICHLSYSPLVAAGAIRFAQSTAPWWQDTVGLRAVVFLFAEAASEVEGAMFTGRAVEITTLIFWYDWLLASSCCWSVDNGILRFLLSMAILRARLLEHHMPTLLGCRVLSASVVFLLGNSWSVSFLAFCCPSFGKLDAFSTATTTDKEARARQTDNQQRAGSRQNQPCSYPSCPYLFDSPDCIRLQRDTGCHACDRRGCWRMSLNCRFTQHGGSRESHSDAGFSDSVPHMRQVNGVCIADGLVVSGSQRPRWMECYREVHLVSDTAVFALGRASGDGYNCLIDTLRQVLNIVCNVPAVRAALETRIPSILPGDFLELELHGQAIVDLLLIFNLAVPSSSRRPVAKSCRIVCFDLLDVGNGDVVGGDGLALYIARVNRNHFVPLLRRHDNVSHIVAAVPAGNSTGDGVSSRESSIYNSRHKQEKGVAAASSTGAPPASVEVSSAPDSTFASLPNVPSALAAASSKQDKAHAAASSTTTAPSPHVASGPGSVFEGLLGDVQEDPIPELPDISDRSSDSAQSDIDDVFDMCERVEGALPDTYRSSVHMCWLSAVRDLAAQLRPNLNLPLKPGSATDVFDDVASGVRVPLWHCPFKNCVVNSTSTGASCNHEQGMWAHVWQLHGEQLRGLLVKHQMTLIDRSVEKAGSDLFLQPRMSRSSRAWISSKRFS